jgi:hypothetical protein
MTGASADELLPLIRAFHYSRRIPSNPQHCFAVRKPGGLFGENGEAVAGIIFSLAQAKWSEPVLELSRLVRSPEYKEPLTKLIAFSVEWLKRNKWDLVISYADWTQTHHGGIYQAASWLYDGKRDRAMDGLIVNGVFVPGRSCNASYGSRSPEKVSAILPGQQVEPHYDEGKHLYWKPLSRTGKKQAIRLGLKSLKYPKPNADGPLDERLPSRASFVQPEASAPTLLSK